MEMLGPFSKLSIYIGNTRSIETRCEGRGVRREGLIRGEEQGDTGEKRREGGCIEKV